MIDPGVESLRQSALDDRDFAAWRHSDSQWRIFLGENPALLENASPKLRAPEFDYVFENFVERLQIETKDFSVHGSLAPGGLSGAWGSGVGAFTEEELEGYPITRADLAPSYDAVAKRIGVSGSDRDELSGWFGADYPLQSPNPLRPPFSSLYGRHLARSSTNVLQRSRNDFRLGRPQQAVLTQHLGGRQACDLRSMCIYGCSRRAIYSAAFELDSLRAHPNFTYTPGWFATRVAREDGALVVQAANMNGADTRAFTGSRVLLAAGTIASTKLALEFVGAYDVDVPLLTTPVLAFALLTRDLRLPPSANGYALGLLAFALRLAGVEPEPEVFGGILPTTGLLPTELYGRLPLLRPWSRILGGWLWPRLLVGTCFFPGRFSRNKLRVRAGGALAIEGGYSEDLADAHRKCIRRLRREFASLGAMLLPGSTGLSRPGEEMHYGGTLPMRTRPGSCETDDEGRLHGVEDLHIVDGSVLTSLPAKSHTLTIMANADRIARRVAAKYIREEVN
jgi:choline dehydrogenase-like flavoprotein